MIHDYKGLIDTRTIPESSIYMIHGNPRILQNEVEKRIENYFNKYEFLYKKNYIIDGDASIEDIENELQNLSLFDKSWKLNFFHVAFPFNCVLARFRNYLNFDFLCFWK